MAPCHVIVGLWFAQFYIPGAFIFAILRLRLSEVSFVCNKFHNPLRAYHQYRVQAEKRPIGITNIVPHPAHRVAVMPRRNSQQPANLHVPLVLWQTHR